MIPAEVWQNWGEIFYEVIRLITGNVILSFFLGEFVVLFIVNLIVRLSSPKKED